MKKSFLLLFVFSLSVLFIFSSSVKGAYTTDFTVVTLSSPPDATLNVSLTPTLQWQQVVDANGYYIQINRVADFTLNFEATVWMMVIGGQVQSKQLSSGLLSTNKNYEWCVRAIKTDRTDRLDANQEYSFDSIERYVTRISPACLNRSSGGAQVGQWYLFRTTQVSTTVPTPRPSSPNATTPGYLPLQLNWTVDGTVDSFQYTVQNPNASVVCSNTSVAGTVRQAACPGTDNFYLYSEALYSSNYRWQIKAKIGSTEGDWSSWQLFKVDLSQPTNLSPTSIVGAPPILSCNAVPGANKYEWEISKGGTVISTERTATNQYNTGSLSLVPDPNVPYVWKVTPIKMRLLTEEERKNPSQFVKNLSRIEGNQVREYGSQSATAQFYYRTDQTCVQLGGDWCTSGQTCKTGFTDLANQASDKNTHSGLVCCSGGTGNCQGSAPSNCTATLSVTGNSSTCIYTAVFTAANCNDKSWAIEELKSGNTSWGSWCGGADAGTGNSCGPRTFSAGTYTFKLLIDGVEKASQPGVPCLAPSGQTCSQLNGGTGWCQSGQTCKSGSTDLTSQASDRSSYPGRVCCSGGTGNCQTSTPSGQTCQQKGGDCCPLGQSCKTGRISGASNCPECCPRLSDCTFLAISNPLGSANLEELVNKLINFIFNIAIVLAPLMIIFGGVLFTTSAGDVKKLDQAKRIILYTAIGLLIILLSKGILAIINQILGVR